MKVLVATRLTQGTRDNDFFWCNEGELVRLGGECDSDRGNPDGGCGCVRSFGGVDSNKGTTTALVEERDLTMSEYSRLVGAYASEIALVANQFDVGDVVEKRGSAYDSEEVRLQLDSFRKR